MEALLALEDGLTFKGKSFGAQGETSGEVVFNTSLTGYQEILTDPFLRRPDCYSHLSSDWQLRCQPSRCGIQLAHMRKAWLCGRSPKFPSNWRQQTSLAGLPPTAPDCRDLRYRYAGIWSDTSGIMAPCRP